MELKATSKVSGLTYKNVYCGMCNGEKLEDLDVWLWNFDCTDLNVEGGTQGTGEKSILDIIK